MQDELTKHTLKIYQTMKRPGRSFWEKAKEIAIEVLIIVFAVTLSIWLHNWSDHREQQKVTDEFLQGIRKDLQKDIVVMEENKGWYVHVDTNFEYLLNLDESGRVDTATEHTVAHHLDFALRTTHANVARYEGFKSSAKMGTIESDSLRQAILLYYQQTIPGVNDLEEVVNSFQTRLMEAEVNKSDGESLRVLAKTFKVRALLEFNQDNLGPAIKSYTEAQNEARRIIKMVDVYLQKGN